ncbi:MAG TPA: response regulator transcription factor [Thermoanaerobaculia bacterium]|jgi:DNA-binding NarL/FixJ family response regulator|nr:response regulator transcription factor [Thermoanaerobaculia bacterium]
MTPPETLRIAVVEDDAAAQEALRLLIDGTQGFRCVGAYGSAELGLEGLALMKPSPDVLLLDINLPGMLGSEAARHFHERHPGMAILMLTLFYDEDRIFEALCNGASGYLLKKTPPGRLLGAVLEAVERGAPLSPDIAHKVIQLFREVRPSSRGGNDLSNLERKLLSLLADGHSHQSAAADLRISPAAIPVHVRSIYGKLRAHARSEDVSRRLKAGLV